ncbi:MAG: amino acid synthesis family protein [Actinomycetota bacterium]
MTTPAFRRLAIRIEEAHTEMGRTVDPPRRKVAVGAIVDNPLAGTYADDLETLYDLGKNLSGHLATRGVEALGVAPNDITGYGKATIVGTDGEIEHAAALMHPRFGAPVRVAVDHGDDIITSTKIVAGAGATITVPLTNKDSIWEFDDMDSIEFAVSDGPRPHEFVVVVALSIGGRPLARTRKDP